MEETRQCLRGLSTLKTFEILVGLFECLDFFPVQGSQMKKYTPELHVTCQYMKSNKQSMSGLLGKMTVVMKTLIKLNHLTPLHPTHTPHRLILKIYGRKHVINTDC